MLRGAYGEANEALLRLYCTKCFLKPEIPRKDKHNP